MMAATKAVRTAAPEKPLVARLTDGGRNPRNAYMSFPG